MQERKERKSMNPSGKWHILAFGMYLTAALLSGCGGETGSLPETATPTAETSASVKTTPAGPSVSLATANVPEQSAVATENVRTPADVAVTDHGTDEHTSAGETILDEDGTYSSMEDVSLYLHTYGELPDNFITKNEARELGWSGGGLEAYAPGMCIGGDRFGNYEGLLPEGTYHECDIDTLGATSRGAERLVWDEDGNIYYTSDHYESFELVYTGEAVNP